MSEPKWMKRILLSVILSFFLVVLNEGRTDRKELQDKIVQKELHEGFGVCVIQRQGVVTYEPEMIVSQMAFMMLPEKTDCSSFYELYHSLNDTQKMNFWKTLMIFNRTNLYHEWKKQLYQEKVFLDEDKYCIKNSLCGKNTIEGKDELLDDALSAQKATQGIIMDNIHFYMPYFFLSNGNTRKLCVDEVCIKSSECLQDKVHDDFVSIKKYSKKEFLHKLSKIVDMENKKLSDMKLCMDEFGYVEEIQIGELNISPNEFRILFGLDTFSFSIIEQNKSILIQTNGIGHGYGLCVNYCLYLASKDTSYDEILSYFFGEISLERKYGA